jgi:hypothetical protein
MPRQPVQATGLRPTPAVVQPRPATQTGGENFLEQAIPLVVGAGITAGLVYLLGPAGPAAAAGVLGASAPTATAAGLGIAGMGAEGVAATAALGGGLTALGSSGLAQEHIGQPIGAMGTPGGQTPQRQSGMRQMRPRTEGVRRQADSNLQSLAPRGGGTPEEEKDARTKLIAASSGAMMQGFMGG